MPRLLLPLRRHFENRSPGQALVEATNTSVGIAPADIALSCDPDCSAALDHRVTVKVTGHFQLLTPFLTPFFGGKQTILFGVASTTQIEKLPPPPSPVILTSAPPSPTPTPTATPTATPTPTPSPTPTGGTCAQPSAGFTTSF